MKFRLYLLLLPFLLAACGGQPPKPVTADTATAAVAVPPAPTFPDKKAVPASTLKRGGGFYQDDGPAADVPIDLASVPDAVPRAEPPHRFANRPYAVLGRDYTPLPAQAAYRQHGVASWYGRKFHGQKTSSGEPYDMFGMTAAHPTLPIPSYVRVTRLNDGLNGGPETGKSVVVRVNDRGPFLHGRVIDLSYTAAWKLGLIGNGSGTVSVERVLPGETPPVAFTASASAPIQLASADSPSAPAMSSTASPRTLRDIEERSGHYLQLGAFSSRDNAESLKARLARSLGDLSDKLLIRRVGDLHRLQLGPWVDSGEARRIAEQLKAAFDLPSVLVK